MPKTSFLTKLVLVVMIAAIVPFAASAQEYMCAPGSCTQYCPPGTYDCTSQWMGASYDNFMIAMYMWASGYTVTACCY